MTVYICNERITYYYFPIINKKVRCYNGMRTIKQQRLKLSHNNCYQEEFLNYAFTAMYNPHSHFLNVNGKK